MCACVCFIFVACSFSSALCGKFYYNFTLHDVVYVCAAVLVAVASRLWLRCIVMGYVCVGHSCLCSTALAGSPGHCTCVNIPRRTHCVGPGSVPISMCVRACVRVCVCACVHACVRACVRASVRVCFCVLLALSENAPV
jgi:hypothetical protein